jgi:mono/diheme cytochrome c family protein
MSAAWRLALALLVLAPLAVRAQPAADVVKRGEYLTRAADCAACHSAPGRLPWTGGRAFVLPFGTLYSPNITPDPETGIGGYSDDDWVSALQDGVGRGGKHLYPAMPYNSYTLMTRDDALAIKAYLMSLPPVHAVPPENQMKFPFDQRWVMAFWNVLNNPGHRLQPDASKSADWNRGAYLVEALGHCEQCHTPRNFMQGLKSSAAFGGTEQVGWLAYNISNDQTVGVGGWTDAALEQYLATGHADGHGPASGPMAEAVENSLHYMTPADIHAMVVYLRSVPAQPSGPPAVQGGTAPVPADGAAASSRADALGAHIFAEACAGCHLPNGTGRQSPWAALAGDHTTGDPSGTNLVQVLAHGTQLDTSQGLMFMHNFTASYTDPELAAVANYVIAQFGDRQGHVTPQQLAAARNGDQQQPSPFKDMGEIAFAAAAVAAIALVGSLLFVRRTRPPPPLRS